MQTTHSLAKPCVDTNTSQWEDRTRVRDYDENATFQQIWYSDLLKKVTANTRLSGDILDIGCSSGIFISHQARQNPGANFHGLDYSNAMIEQAKSQYTDQPNLNFFQGDATNLKAVPGLKQQYTLILAATVLHWIEQDQDKKSALQSMYDKLSPGGQAIIRTFDEAKDTPFLDPALSTLTELLPGTALPFLPCSMANYMDMGRELAVDSLRFEPSTVTVLLPKDSALAKSQITQWLNSWYKAPEGVDADHHLDQLSEGILSHSTFDHQNRQLAFHFVDMIISKFDSH